jgi:hypothetical protein
MWIATGNPQRPLTCVWIDADSNIQRPDMGKSPNNRRLSEMPTFVQVTRLISPAFAN